MHTPAPGTYNISRSAEGPKYTMYTKLDRTSYIGVELEKYRGKPAPGAYNPNYSKTVKNGGIFTIRGKIEYKEEDRAPGPGAYHSRHDSATKVQPSWRFSSGP